MIPHTVRLSGEYSYIYGHIEWFFKLFYNIYYSGIPPNF